jgi:hypothetical protein
MKTPRSALETGKFDVVELVVEFVQHAYLTECARNRGQ